MNEVSLLGLGAMGRPMALNLAASGVDLVVWNRTRAKAAVLAERGVPVANTPAGAAAGVVITVLTDLPDVEDLLDGPTGLLAGWSDADVVDPVLVVMGTVSPPRLRALGDRLAVDGVRVVDAPVSGGDVGAQRGTLSIMVGGAPEPVRRVWPYLMAMGSTVRHLGALGSGQVAKSCNQIIVAAEAMVIAEAMTYARGMELDLTALVELLTGGLADSEMLRQKGWRYVERNYDGGGALRNQVKDLRFALEAGRERGIPLPMAAASEQFFAGLVAMGYGEEDHTAAQRVYELLQGRMVST